jgi:hypothetical protein
MVTSRITWIAENIIGMRIPKASNFHEIIFHFLSPQPPEALRPAQPPIQSVPVPLLPAGKATRA